MTDIGNVLREMLLNGAGGEQFAFESFWTISGNGDDRYEDESDTSYYSRKSFELLTRIITTDEYPDTKLALKLYLS